MGLIAVLIAIVIFVLCLGGNHKRKGFIGVLVALLYFPIGVILALTKKYK